MTRRTTAAALCSLLVLSVGACSSETEEYCGTLADNEQTLTDLAKRSGGKGDVLGPTLEVWRELHDDAPADIEDEWSTLVFALEGLVDAFRGAGTDPGAFDPADPPEGVTKKEADRVRDAAAELVSDRVSQAGKAVEQHARDVCDTDLGLGTG